MCMHTALPLLLSPGRVSQITSSAGAMTTASAPGDGSTHSMPCTAHSPLVATA
jgi:hypothetical protein